LTDTAGKEAAEGVIGAMSSVFRRVNDSIRELAARTAGDDLWSFFCECDDAACREQVGLTVKEFDARRNDGHGEPILAAIHGNGASSSAAA